MAEAAAQVRRAADPADRLCRTRAAILARRVTGAVVPSALVRRRGGGLVYQPGQGAAGRGGLRDREAVLAHRSAAALLPCAVVSGCPLPVPGTYANVTYVTVARRRVGGEHPPAGIGRRAARRRGRDRACPKPATGGRAHRLGAAPPVTGQRPDPYRQRLLKNNRW